MRSSMVKIVSELCRVSLLIAILILGIILYIYFSSI